MTRRPMAAPISGIRRKRWCGCRTPSPRPPARALPPHSFRRSPDLSVVERQERHSASASSCTAGSPTRMAGRSRTRSSRSGRPMRRARYQHPADQHDAPTDPNFRGEGRRLHRRRGLVSVHLDQARRLSLAQSLTMPGARTTSTSRFSVPGFAQRLVTQMYFPGDPLLELDPVFLSVPDEGRAQPPRLHARHDGHRARMGVGLSLGRRTARPRGDADGELSRAERHRQPDDRALLALDRAPGMGRSDAVRRRQAAVALTGSVIDGDGNPVTDAAVELWQSDPPADDHFPGFGRSRTTRPAGSISRH